MINNGYMYRICKALDRGILSFLIGWNNVFSLLIGLFDIFAEAEQIKQELEGYRQVKQKLGCMFFKIKY
ncbi:MAG: hypothetical protein GY749_48150 [Desulfobacteraceae bacterium]|nr:hypothetical protein [Desulfobacteraceae bacterium]